MATPSRLGLTALNKCHPNNLPDALRQIAGPEVAIGDLLNLMIAKINQAQESVGASQTITIGGTFAAGGTITTTVGSLAGVPYTVVAGDTNLNGVATSVAAALNANAAFAAAYTASAASAVVTVTAKRKGTGANGTTFTVGTASMGTLTATAGGASLTGGTGLDDILAIIDPAAGVQVVV